MTYWNVNNTVIKVDSHCCADWNSDILECKFYTVKKGDTLLKNWNSDILECKFSSCDSVAAASSSLK